MSHDILVVDDDPNLREVVCYALTIGGFRVRQASDGRQALAEIERQAPDLMVLDVLMPELDGLGVCRAIRSHATEAVSRLPILFLSSRDEEVDRVLGLEMGGDDYLTKPFSTRELVSRVRAVLRRTRPSLPATNPRTLKAGGVQIDLEAHRVYVSEQEIDLTATEFRILSALIRRPGRLYTRDDLIQRAYDGVHVAERTLDSHIRGIRRKLRDAGIEPIETVHGVGYRFSS